MLRKKNNIKKLKEESLKLWSKIIRKKDKYTCQWCGSKKNTQAHHIVARSISNHFGWFDKRNGITLCMRCHMYEIQKRPDEYITMRDNYLNKKNISYWCLRDFFDNKKLPIKFTVDIYEKLIKNLKKELDL